MIKNENGNVEIVEENDVNVLLEIEELLEEYVKQNPDSVHRAVLSSMCEMICKKGHFVRGVDRNQKNQIIEEGIRHGKRTQTMADEIIEELREALLNGGI